MAMAMLVAADNDAMIDKPQINAQLLRPKVPVQTMELP